ncbi:slit homolog 3 protein-like [Daphnia carinata]|uniref:slit homolog 3 protein-like n=1 Tax=Daphnia carinata TaxID=120202 RepID=UPI0028697657|nr:slit homolog 3 protein-like [Daphnia carinata]
MTKMQLKCLVLSLLLVILTSVNGERAVCTEDYTPCTCDSSTGRWDVICDQVPIEQVKSLFNRTTPQDLASFRLTTAFNETNGIPDNLLGNSRASGIIINCLEASYELQINDNAFISSANFTKTVTINGCYLIQQRNFMFLSGFGDMTSLNIYNSRNFTSFLGIPSQSSLYYISILNSRGFENLLDSDAVALPGLRILYLYDNDMNDLAVSNVLKALALSSLESLEELRLYNNRLTRIPAMISSFSKLSQLMMANNKIDLIVTRSLAFYGDVSYLHLGNNNIRTIEPSAFGAHRFGLVYLHQNSLTHFESYVFQVMLEGMVQAGYGSVSLFQNPIECDCHLAWLIYYKRNLLPVIDGGQCSNSTLFTDLNPDALSGCPVFTCPANIDGNFPNPLSCTSYYACSRQDVVLVECPGGLVFNPAYQLCDWPYNVPTCNV